MNKILGDDSDQRNKDDCEAGEDGDDPMIIEIE